MAACEEASRDLLYLRPSVPECLRHLNLQPHLASSVTATIKQAGADVLRLPPYSSDYTPIEEMWSKAKQYVRRAAARTCTGLYDALGEALEHVTAQDIMGWFQHAGLCATRC